MAITVSRDDGTVLELISIPFDYPADEIFACDKIVSDIEMLFETEEMEPPATKD